MPIEKGAHTTWTVLDHGPLRKPTSEIWHVEGALPDMPIRRVMTVARTSDGRLVVHNPIALADPAMAEIEAWGPVSFLLVPNGWHRLDARVYKQRYPGARVLCPEGSRSRVEKVVGVDGTYDDLPRDEVVQLAHLDGVKRREGYMRVSGPSGTSLVFNDVVFNLPRMPGLFGLVYHLLGSSGRPKVTPLLKLFLVQDKRELRAQLERLAELPRLQRVIVMHGQSVEAGDPVGPRELLRAAASSL